MSADPPFAAAELLDPRDTLERQRDKLLVISDALMRRVEAATDDGGAAYAQFQRAALLEDQVRARTRDLDQTLDALNRSNSQLAEATAAAEAARRNLADAIGAVDEGFALFGPDERLVMCNAQFCAYFPDVQPHLVPGLSFWDYIDLVSLSRHLALPEGEPPEVWAARRCARHGDLQAVFNVGLVRDRWLQISERRMENGGTVILQTDVSDALQRERRAAHDAAMEEARRIHAARARFVAAASHDLLQPLAAAKLFIGLVESGAAADEAGPVLLKAQNALGQVEGILAQLLDISRLETGRFAVQSGPVPLQRVLAPLAEEFAVIAADRGLGFTLVASHAVVVSDASWLRRILQNLIGNALRYTRKGRVLVGVRHLPQALRIEVHDTGPGIVEADRALIFQEFQRLEAPASAAEGMGLGLAIVERACTALGHGLELRSVPGQGSCFAVTVRRPERGASERGAGLNPSRPVADRLRSR